VIDRDRRSFLRLGFLVGAGLLFGGSPLRANDGLTPYTVKRGDTLASIARDGGISIAELRAANNLSGDRILAGQTLFVPPRAGEPLVHVVVRGETLGVIARRHNVSVAAIRQANGLSSDRILVGQQLLIPRGPGSTMAYRYIGNVIAATGKIRLERSRWKYVVGHHSAINRGNARIYDRFHRERMRMVHGLAYHFVIGNGVDSGDGQIEIGPRWLQQLHGGHVRRQDVNDSGIGICVVGNFEQTRPTRRQLEAFTELVHYLRDDVAARPPKFAVHREIDRSHTLCPGRHFPTQSMHRLFS
jgi:LysM repeat protein